MEEYLVPTGEGIGELIEKKSRFIGHIWKVESEAEAIEALNRTRQTMWDARHHVYAYTLRNGIMRYSDDGEPQGTGGMPVLDVLRKQELNNVLCVVTRYFGGILLGTGGLVRAYSKAAALAVENAGISIMRQWQDATLPLPYSLFERIRLIVADYQGQVLHVDYGADVTMQIRLPMGSYGDFCAKITDISCGSLTPVPGEQVFLPGKRA